MTDQPNTHEDGTDGGGAAAEGVRDGVAITASVDDMMAAVSSAPLWGQVIIGTQELHGHEISDIKRAIGMLVTMVAGGQVRLDPALMMRLGIDVRESSRIVRPS